MLSPPLIKHFVSMDVSFFETHYYFYSSQTHLQGESKIEEDCFDSVTYPYLYAGAYATTYGTSHIICLIRTPMLQRVDNA
jgi:hypothetical protein